MAMELGKLVESYPNMEEVLFDLASRVRSLGGPTVLPENSLPETPSIKQIGDAVINQGDEYQGAGLFLLNSARFFSAVDRMPRVIRNLGGKEYARFLCQFEGDEIILRRSQYYLLAFFSLSPNKVYSCRELSNEVFPDYCESIVNTTVDRLRDVLEVNPSNPKRLVTIGGHGIGHHGYIWRPKIDLD